MRVVGGREQAVRRLSSCGGEGCREREREGALDRGREFKERGAGGGNIECGPLHAGGRPTR